MFGFYRLYLAIVVVASHYLTFQSIGLWAVLAFFILSGFLMTTIMNESYGYSYQGVKKYAINRWLRLYPSYYFVAFCTVAILLILPGDNEDYIPDTFPEILANATMLFPSFYPLDYLPKLSSTTWALTLEIFFYALIAIGISRSARISLVWLFLSFLYLIIMNVKTGFTFGVRYGNMLEASLPFAIGAVLYHFKEQLRGLLTKWNAMEWRFWILLFVLNQAVVIISPMIFGDNSWKVGLLASYVNLGLSAVIVVMLFYTTASDKWQRYDALMGQFSYPIYLSHPIAAVVTARLYGYGNHMLHDWFMLLTASALTLLLSAMCVYLIDNNVERVRRRIKAKAIAS